MHGRLSQGLSVVLIRASTIDRVDPLHWHSDHLQPARWPEAVAVNVIDNTTGKIARSRFRGADHGTSPRRFWHGGVFGSSGGESLQSSHEDSLN
jgi:hypothetical protein